MELLYLWINNNNCIHCQEFNFSSEYRIKVDDTKEPQRIIIEKNKLNTLNIYKTDSILNVTAVVGSNGSGKSSLLSFIANNICHYKFENGKEYERFEYDSYQKEKSIYVFKDDNNEIFIYHNLEIDLDGGSYRTIHNTEESFSSLTDLRKQTIVYLTNSLFVNEHLENYSHSYPVINYNIHPSSLYMISRNFYEKLFSIDKVNDDELNNKISSWHINPSCNKNGFQNILDLCYYAFLVDNDCIGKIDKIMPFSICIESSIAIINRSVTSNQNTINHLKDKSKEFVTACSKLTQKIKKNNLYTLYHNLLFEMFYDKNIDDILALDTKSIDDIFNIIFKKYTDLEQYKKYYIEIKKFISIAEKFPLYNNLFDNKSDIAYKFDRVISYNEKESVFEELVHFVNEHFIKCDSYVLRYLKIRDNYMSSGERALTNFFSWLVAIPSFDNIMDNVPEENDDSIASEDVKDNTMTTYNNNYLLLIDEIDLYSHPEWQRQIIKVLIDRLGIVLKNKKVQIILTTHSPLLLSDFPKSNTIYLRKNDICNSVVCDSKLRKETFGANIYTILKDAFFLENGAVGEFARCKLLELSDRLNKMKEEKDDEALISKVGSEIIKNELRKKYIKVKRGESTSKKHLSEKNNEELIQLRTQLKNSITVIEKMIIEGENNDTD